MENNKLLTARTKSGSFGNLSVGFSDFWWDQLSPINQNLVRRIFELSTVSWHEVPAEETTKVKYVCNESCTGSRHPKKGDTLFQTNSHVWGCLYTSLINEVVAKGSICQRCVFGTKTSRWFPAVKFPSIFGIRFETHCNCQKSLDQNPWATGVFLSRGLWILEWWWLFRCKTVRFGGVRDFANTCQHFLFLHFRFFVDILSEFYRFQISDHFSLENI